MIDMERQINMLIKAAGCFYKKGILKSTWFGFGFHVDLVLFMEACNIRYHVAIK